MKIVEKTKETNDLGYKEIDIHSREFEALGDNLLVKWELCQEKLKVGKFILNRPDTHRRMHYTGEVLGVGPDVDPAIEVGDRIVFDQFSDPDKYFDECYGRVALLKEKNQGQLFMKISARTLVEGSELEYDYQS